MLDSRPQKGNMLVYHSWAAPSGLSGSLHPVCLCPQDLFEFLTFQGQHPGEQELFQQDRGSQGRQALWCG